MDARATQADYNQLLGMARRCAFGAVEPEDLVQEAMLIALRQGRKLSERRWLSGVMRNLAFVHHRASQRRLHRDTRASEASVQACENTALPRPLPQDFMTTLPTSLRLVLQLSLSGHTRVEIRYLLHLSDEALRQRISQLRRRIAEAGVSVPEVAPSGALMFGSIRQSLHRLGAHMPGGFGSHDPDGHLFVISGAHKTGTPGHLSK